MSVFIAGDKARDFNRLTRAERKAQVLKEMSHRFGADGAQLSERITFPAVGPQNPQPDAYFEFNWSMDEWIRPGGARAGWTRALGRRRHVDVLVSLRQRCGAIR